jgi:alcohol dehydrogenase (cytochrome c)
VSGKLLLGKPFIKTMTWAKGIGADGRPVMLPGQEPSAQGTKVCPSQDGATNWFSPSFHPGTGLFYVQAMEKCSMYFKREDTWQAGRAFLGGTMRNPQGDKPQKFLRAIDLQTGEVKWEVPQQGFGFSWGGILTTAGGLAIYGEDSGSLVAADVTSGKALWSFAANSSWKASPMTYSFDGKQFVAMAGGSTILAFGLVD